MQVQVLVAAEILFVGYQGDFFTLWGDSFALFWWIKDSHVELNGPGEAVPMHDSDEVADTDLDQGFCLQISGKQWADGGGNHVVSTTGAPAGEGQCCSSSSCPFTFLGRAVRSSPWTSVSPQCRRARRSGQALLWWQRPTASGEHHMLPGNSRS